MCIAEIIHPQFIQAPKLKLEKRGEDLERKGALIMGIKGGEKIWTTILSLFAYFSSFPTFHQVLFCGPKTEEHEIEQFLQRAFFF